MSVFWQSVLAVFAAVGFYTVLHTVYEIVFVRMLRLHGSAELTLYGDGCDASSEQMIRTALRIRKQYLHVYHIRRDRQRTGPKCGEAYGGAAGHDVFGMTRK